MDLEIDRYLQRNFSDFLPGAEFNLLAEGTKRTAFRNVRILDRWLTRNFGDRLDPSRGTGGALLPTNQVESPIAMNQLVAFMMYRVAGERLSDDIHSGSVALSTFLHSDLVPMLKLLRYQGRITFTSEDLKQSQAFKDVVLTCRKIRGEVAVFSSSRPLYPQDEARLRSCLTMDTASKRDEAIIVLALRSGFRTKSLSLIRLDLHVQELDCPALEILMPGCKTTRVVDFRQLLVGEDYVVLMNWICRRRQIFRGCPYLFVTKNGTQISCDSVTMMLSDLSICAGYGRGYFSSHSLRVGYASRVAADGYSRDDSTEQVYQRLCDGKRWARNSKSVCKYIDPNLKSFFREGLGMTIEQFFASNPKLVHGLSFLGPQITRPIDWFNTSESKLLSIATNLGLLGTLTQERVMLAAGRALFCLDSNFREFVNSVEEASHKSLNRILVEVIGCLLEDDVADVSRVYRGSTRDDLFECLIVDKLEGGHIQTARRAQQTVVHTLRDRASAEQLLHNLQKKRVYDRKLHLGILRDERLVLMRSREIEDDCREAQLPELDLDVHFPLHPEILDAPPAGVTVLTPEHPRNQPERYL